MNIKFKVIAQTVESDPAGIAQEVDFKAIFEVSQLLNPEVEAPTDNEMEAMQTLFDGFFASLEKTLLPAVVHTIVGNVDDGNFNKAKSVIGLLSSAVSHIPGVPLVASGAKHVVEKLRHHHVKRQISGNLGSMDMSSVQGNVTDVMIAMKSNVNFISVFGRLALNEIRKGYTVNIDRLAEKVRKQIVRASEGLTTDGLPKKLEDIITSPQNLLHKDAFKAPKQLRSIMKSYGIKMRDSGCKAASTTEINANSIVAQTKEAMASGDFVEQATLFLESAEKLQRHNNMGLHDLALEMLKSALMLLELNGTTKNSSTILAVKDLMAQNQKNKLEEKIEIFENALAQKKEYHSADVDITDRHDHIAVLHGLNGNQKAVINHLEGALQHETKILGRENEDTIDRRDDLAARHDVAGNAEVATTHLETALEVRSELKIIDENTVSRHDVLAERYDRVEDKHKAIEHLESALRFRTESLKIVDSITVSRHDKLASLLVNTNDIEGYLNHKENALRVKEETLNVVDADNLNRHDALAKIYGVRKNIAEQIKHLHGAFDDHLKLEKNITHSTVFRLDTLSALYVKQDLPKAALDLFLPLLNKIVGQDFSSEDRKIMDRYLAIYDSYTAKYEIEEDHRILHTKLEALKEAHEKYQLEFNKYEQKPQVPVAFTSPLPIAVSV